MKQVGATARFVFVCSVLFVKNLNRGGEENELIFKKTQKILLKLNLEGKNYE